MNAHLLLWEEDLAIFEDAGYASEECMVGSRELRLRWKVRDKAKPGRWLSASQKRRNRKQSGIRARVKHGFRVIKQ